METLKNNIELVIAGLVAFGGSAILVAVFFALENKGVILAYLQI